MNKKKIAQTTLRVCVLEGDYTHLQTVGVPLPLCIQTQELGLSLNATLWTAKQSYNGFSVSFWPMSVVGYPPHRLSKPSKRRRRRRRRRNNRNNSPPKLMRVRVVRRDWSLARLLNLLLSHLPPSHLVPTLRSLFHHLRKQSQAVIRWILDPVSPWLLMFGM